MVIGLVSTALSALVTTSTVVCSSTVPSADLGLLAEAVESLSKAASAALSSSIDTSSSSALVLDTIPSSPKEVLEVVPMSAELASAAKSPVLETVSAAAISVSSLSAISAAAPDGSPSSLEDDDELLKSSYTKERKHENTVFTKSRVPQLNTYRYLNWNTNNCVSSLLRLPQNRNYVNIIRKMHQLTNKEVRIKTLTLFSE
jgi:hypothetical protein